MKNINFEKEIAKEMSKTDFSNEPITKLNSILRELKAFINSGVYSKEKFKQEVHLKFANCNFENFAELAKTNRTMLLEFSSTRDEALKTINELLTMSQNMMFQVQYGEATRKFAKQFFSDIEKNFSK